MREGIQDVEQYDQTLTVDGDFLRRHLAVFENSLP